MLVSIEDIADFESDFGVADLVLVSVGLANVVSPWVLSRAVLEEFLQSAVIVALDLFLDKDGHRELLGNNDFIGANSGITSYNSSTEFTDLFAHDFASNCAFLAT